RSPKLLLPLLFEDQDFLCAIVLDDSRFNLGVGEKGIADLNVSIVFDKQHIAELNFCANFSGYLFQPNRLSGRHAILLSARSDHGIHSELLLSEDKHPLYIRRGPQKGTRYTKPSCEFCTNTER